MNQLSSYSDLSQGQIQIIDLVARLKTPEEVEGVKKAVVSYLASRLDDELNNLWDKGSLNDEKIESFRNLHERTPYRPKDNNRLTN